jgi:hypothetical protein
MLITNKQLMMLLAIAESTLNIKMNCIINHKQRIELVETIYNQQSNMLKDIEDDKA